MTRKLLFVWMALLVLVPVANSAADSLETFQGHQGTLNIAGGTAHIPVMKEAAKRIMTRHAGIVITIAGGGSGLGIKQAGEGLVDIGNTGRMPTPEEIERYNLQVHQWAMDGVAVVVHPKNPVRALTQAQLKEIYAGKIGNWAALGGTDRSITLYTREEASGTREVFWEKALGKSSIDARALFVQSNGAMKTAVANDPYAIGYVSVGHIDAGVAPVVLNGVAPSRQTVVDGSYAVSRGLYSTTRGEAAGLARLFLEYLFTPEGQHIISENGFIPTGPR
jgi:phosphate transport system substrate-binding protein